MLKGCQREMIVLQTAESSLFESAYFILRRQRVPPPKCDMLAEANRIVESGNGYFGRQKGQKKRRFLLFFGGFLSGGCAVALLWICLRLCT